MATQEDNTKLASLVDERRLYWAKVIPIILDLVEKRGELVSQRERDDSTYTHRRLEMFGGFRFDLEEGICKMSDSKLSITHYDNLGPKLVCELLSEHTSFSADRFLHSGRIKFISNDNPWLSGLQNALESAPDILKQKEDQAATDTHASEEQERINREFSSLRREALRLGIRIPT
jgi:hypothetical protein